MTNILVLTSKRPRDVSHSQRLTNRALDELHARYPAAHVMVRDIAQIPLPRAGTFFAEDMVLGGRKRGTSGGTTVGQSEELIDELFAADVLVIAVPMIDFSIPASLKAWVDHVTRRGHTFQYTDGLPHGLVTGKKAVIVRPKNRSLADPRQEADYQAPYLRQMLGFLGMTDIELIDVDITSTDPEPDDTAGHHVWERDVERRFAAPSSLPAPVTGSTYDVAASPRHAGAERRRPSPSPQSTPLGATAAKATRLKAHW